MFSSSSAASPVPHDASQAPPKPAGVAHLYVFVHGFGAGGAYYGGPVKRAVEARGEGGWVYLSRANTSGWRIGTLWKTAAGIEYGGNRLALEIASLTKTLPNLKELTFIGQSLGGLYSRVAAEKLFGDEPDADSNPTTAGEGKEGAAPGGEGGKRRGRLLPSRVRPGSFVTLSTPHVGVRCLYGRWNAFLLNLVSTGAEANFEDDEKEPLLVRMARGRFLAALKRFQRRISYCPLWDDGVVAYASCAMSHDNTKSRAIPADGADGGSGFVRSSRLTSEPDEVKEPGRAFFAGDQKAGFIQEAINGIRSAGWEIVDVGLDHKRLAVLDPRPNCAQWEKLYPEEVLSDMVRRLGLVNTEKK